jgi:hypothetical protein
MANKEHLKIIRQGVAIWNQWRVQNPATQPDLRDADLSQGSGLAVAYLSGMDLRNADLRSSNCDGVLMPNANLENAMLQDANFFRAVITNVNFRRANMTMCGMADCDLSGSSLIEANLLGADLSGGRMKKVLLGNTIFANTNLARAIDLDTCLHIEPSSLDYQTHSRSGHIPASFLRAIGLPSRLVDYFLTPSEPESNMHSCFISYSVKDQDFADRLYADLQAKGVRCWFAPRDLAPGEFFRQRIDDAIREHDKLLIILSENSIDSSWVQKEFETADEKERALKGTLVLLPIRLDEAVMNTNRAWAADVRRTRHIADFTNWENPDFYRESCANLLRHLKAENANPG